MLEYLSASSLNGDDTFILMQATNPFITENDLTSAIALFNNNPNGSVITCVRNKRFSGLKMESL